MLGKDDEQWPLAGCLQRTTSLAVTDTWSSEDGLELLQSPGRVSTLEGPAWLLIEQL